MKTALELVRLAIGCVFAFVASLATFNGVDGRVILIFVTATLMLLGKKNILESAAAMFTGSRQKVDKVENAQPNVTLPVLTSK